MVTTLGERNRKGSIVGKGARGQSEKNKKKKKKQIHISLVGMY
jgi:hypothetical protein